MALNFFKQSDIDAMDAKNIPLRFKNYFKSLDYAGKVAILGNRYDLAEALGFKLPEEEDEEGYLYTQEQNTISDELDSKEPDKAENIMQEEADESEEDELTEEYDFSQISHNYYEGKNFASIIKNNMEPLEVLALENNTEKCPLHHTVLKQWQVKYTQGRMYSMYVYTCEECHRIYMHEENMSYIHDILVEKGIAHTFYSLDLTNRYLRSQMSEYEISADEKVYVPDLWIEEAPICPIHDEELYEMPCCRSYKDRKVSFTGYFCEKCNKIMVRRAYIDELQDQCATIGVPVIEHETIAKKVPKKKPLPKKEVKPDFIIENGKREKYSYDHIADCFRLTEEDTVVVTDSIYCTLEGHDTEEVLAESGKNMESAIAYAKKMISQAIEIRDQNSGNKNRSILKTAVEFIDSHYMDEEISLNTVANVANVSSNHFSALFSQNMGQTFIEYLTSLRMNKAKELLRCTGMRSSEIAGEIGYKDAHYFSYLFKKTQGMTPSEYRKTRGEV